MKKTQQNGITELDKRCRESQRIRDCFVSVQEEV